MRYLTSTVLLISALILCGTSPSFAQDTEKEKNKKPVIVYNFAKAGFENYNRKKRISMGKPAHNGVLAPFICTELKDAKEISRELSSYGELPPITMKSIAYGIRDEMRLTDKKLAEHGSCKFSGDPLQLLRQKYIVKSTHFSKNYIKIRNWKTKEIYYLPAINSEGMVFTVQQLIPAKISEREFSKRRVPCPKSVKCKKLNDGF